MATVGFKGLRAICSFIQSQGHMFFNASRFKRYCWVSSKGQPTYKYRAQVTGSTGVSLHAGSTENGR